MTVSFSVLERVIFLKQVPLFQDMNIDQLRALAGSCEEEFIPEATYVFQEGDPGGVLYVIVSGRVSIERQGDRKDSVVRLATMETCSSFGEMSLFDNGRRSASAITLDASLFLKLRVEPLIVLMRQHPDVSIQLIKILSRRMRETNEQVVRLTRSVSPQMHQVYDKLQD